MITCMSDRFYKQTPSQPLDLYSRKLQFGQSEGIYYNYLQKYTIALPTVRTETKVVGLTQIQFHSPLTTAHNASILRLSGVFITSNAMITYGEIIDQRLCLHQPKSLKQQSTCRAMTSLATLKVRTISQRKIRLHIISRF